MNEAESGRARADTQRSELHRQLKVSGASESPLGLRPEPALLVQVLWADDLEDGWEVFFTEQGGQNAM